MSAIPQSELALGNRGSIPEQVYAVEILSTEVKQSDTSGKTTLRIRAQIIYPLSVEIGGSPVKTAGRPFDFMPTLTDADLDYGLPAIKAGLEASGFDFTKFNEQGDIDPDKFAALIRHKFQMHLSSFEDKRTRKATADELANNPSQKYVPILDLKGNQISGGWKICSPRKSKGNSVSPSWGDIVGPWDGETGGLE